jgi:DNA-binding response OmpR family regulator
MNILVIEDDKRLGPTLAKGLEEQGYQSRLTRTCQEAKESLDESRADLIILDLGLPDCDGVTFLTELRSSGYVGPVIILTARDTVKDRVVGLDSGANDYLVKPFAFAELLARIRAQLRHGSAPGQGIKIGNITMNLVARQVLVQGENLDLTPREFDLLAYLASNRDQIVSREMLTADVWREEGRFTSLDNVIDVHISRLRKKLGSLDSGVAIDVVRGVGIRLQEA